jgi:hypothetical protein
MGGNLPTPFLRAFTWANEDEISDEEIAKYYEENKEQFIKADT